MSVNPTRNCYTYWVKLVSGSDERFYYGMKTAVGCDPSHLGVHYLTSSRRVKKLLDEGWDAEWCVHRIFGEDFDACVAYEADMIDWLLAHKQKIWLNAYSPKEKKIGMTGQTFSEEHRAKIGDNWRGRQHTEETKAKMREAARGRKLSDEHKAKIGAFSRGRPMPEEAKAAISEKLKGRVMSPEWRAKIAEAGRKRKGEKRKPYKKRAA